MFYKIYLLITLIIFLFLISVALETKQLDVAYVLVALITSLLWLPIFVCYIFENLGGKNDRRRN